VKKWPFSAGGGGRPTAPTPLVTGLLSFHPLISSLSPPLPLPYFVSLSSPTRSCPLGRGSALSAISSGSGALPRPQAHSGVATVFVVFMWITMLFSFCTSQHDKICRRLMLVTTVCRATLCVCPSVRPSVRASVRPYMYCVEASSKHILQLFHHLLAPSFCSFLPNVMAIFRRKPPEGRGMQVGFEKIAICD